MDGLFSINQMPNMANGQGILSAFSALCFKCNNTRAISYLHKVMDALQVGQVIICDIHTDAEVQACIPPVDDLEIPELQRQRQEIRDGKGNL